MTTEPNILDLPITSVVALWYLRRGKFGIQMILATDYLVAIAFLRELARSLGEFSDPKTTWFHRVLAWIVHRDLVRLEINLQLLRSAHVSFVGVLPMDEGDIHR
jgi:hypothetical protein